MNLYAKYEYAKYKVTFATNGGSNVSSQMVTYLGTVTEPSEPTRSGYEFIGWYIDKDLTNKFDFASQVVGEMTIYAGWKELIS